MKMNMKLKSRSHRYDINRFRSRNGHEHTAYKKCLSMTIRMCGKPSTLKQHLKLISWKS